MGCGRSLQEIVAWGTASDADKAAILARSRERRAHERRREAPGHRRTTARFIPGASEPSSQRSRVRVREKCRREEPGGSQRVAQRARRKRQVDASRARRTDAREFRERRDAVVAQPARAAPHDDVAVLERRRSGRSLRFKPPNRNVGRHAERHGHDRLREVALVLVLMQRQPRAGLVAVDEARVGREAREPARPRPLARERRACRRQRRPRRCRSRGRARRSDSRSRSTPSRSAPQFVIATDMRNPPGVSMWRNGAAAATAATARASSASRRSAKPRSSTAPGAKLVERRGRIARVVTRRSERGARDHAVGICHSGTHQPWTWPGARIGRCTVATGPSAGARRRGSRDPRGRLRCCASRGPSDSRRPRARSALFGAKQHSASDVSVPALNNVEVRFWWSKRA